MTDITHSESKKKRVAKDGGMGASSYVRVRQAAVVVHDFCTQNIPKRREAEFKNVFTSALKLVGVIQALVKLKLFLRPQRPLQRQKNVRVLQQKSNDEKHASAARGHCGRCRMVNEGGLTVPAPFMSLVRTRILHITNYC